MFSLVVGLMMMLAMLVAAVTTAIGSGYVISLVTPLSLFQSSVIFLGVIGAFVLVIGMMALHEKLKTQTAILVDKLDWDIEDRDIESEKIHKQMEPMAKTVISRQRERQSRNDLCECGSRRKFKNCCMKKAREREAEIIHF